MAERLDLDAIEARAKAATPGPWLWRNDVELRTTSDRGSYVYGSIVIELRYHEWAGRDPRSEDTDFIAAARTDVPALVARVRELEDQLRNAIRLGDEYRGVAHDRGLGLDRLEAGREAALAAERRSALIEASTVSRRCCPSLACPRAIDSIPRWDGRTPFDANPRSDGGSNE